MIINVNELSQDIIETLENSYEFETKDAHSFVKKHIDGIIDDMFDTLSDRIIYLTNEEER